MTLRRRRGILTEVVPWLALVAAAGAAAFVAVHGVGGATTSATPLTRSIAAATSTVKKPPNRVRPPAALQPRNVTIRATRGDCWLEARTASPAGALLYRGLLRHGRSVRFKGPLVWVRLGASQNVDLRVNGRRRRTPTGIVSVVLRTRR